MWLIYKHIKTNIPRKNKNMWWLWHLQHLQNKANETLKNQKLKYIINNSKIKNKIYIHNNFLKFQYKSIINQKEAISKSNLLRSKLLHIITNKENKYKSILRTYFNTFYYKGIIFNKNKERNIYVKK